MKPIIDPEYDEIRDTLMARWQHSLATLLITRAVCHAFEKTTKDQINVKMDIVFPKIQLEFRRYIDKQLSGLYHFIEIAWVISLEHHGKFDIETIPVDIGSIKVRDEVNSIHHIPIEGVIYFGVEWIGYFVLRVPKSPEQLEQLAKQTFEGTAPDKAIVGEPIKLVDVLIGGLDQNQNPVEEVVSLVRTKVTPPMPAENVTTTFPASGETDEYHGLDAGYRMGESDRGKARIKKDPKRGARVDISPNTKQCCCEQWKHYIIDQEHLYVYCPWCSNLLVDPPPPIEKREYTEEELLLMFAELMNKDFKPQVGWGIIGGKYIEIRGGEIVVCEEVDFGPDGTPLKKED